MKKILLPIFILLISLDTFAQLLPKASPLGTSTQIVGATEVSVVYSRPGVKGRSIFGKLLPFGELWRLGANACTQFTTSDTLQFGEHFLAPGTYALFAIPNEKEWEIIFNTDIEQSGTRSYDVKKDVFRMKSSVLKNSFTETLTLNFEALTDTSATLVILWDELKIALPFKINTKSVALRNIQQAIDKGEDLDQVYGKAADYYFNALADDQKALEFLEKALAIKESYRNLFLKARILHQQGQKEQAVNLAQKALGMAQKEKALGYAGFISSTLEQWSK